jgi:hypothetical protein
MINSKGKIQRLSLLKMLVNIGTLREVARQNHLDNIIHSLVMDKIKITKSISIKVLSKIDRAISVVLIEQNFIHR